MYVTLIIHVINIDSTEMLVSVWFNISHNAAKKQRHKTREGLAGARSFLPCLKLPALVIVREMGTTFYCVFCRCKVKKGTGKLKISEHTILYVLWEKTDASRTENLLNLHYRPGMRLV